MLGLPQFNLLPNPNCAAVDWYATDDDRSRQLEGHNKTATDKGSMSKEYNT